VWHHAHLRGGAVVGSDTNLGKDVYIAEAVTVGNRCKLQNGAFLCNGVTLADEVFVGPNAVFTNDRFPRATNEEWELVPTAVHRGASIGANATIVCGNDIAEFATVAAGSVVTRPVEDHELVAGNPARRLGWVCDCGRVAARTAERPASLRCERCAAHPPVAGVDA
jgi:UDP-2-acetamido-3-amino-2,3-dideoxy-glucuronate N-acetyltransferase